MKIANLNPEVQNHFHQVYMKLSSSFSAFEIHQLHSVLAKFQKFSSIQFQSMYRSSSFLGFLILSLFISISSSSSASIPNNGTTVYEILIQFGLPSGLLPDSVKAYSLSEDGDFVVQLEKPCYIEFDYLTYYNQEITGVLKYGSITQLKGIQVRKFLIWLDVDEIRVDLPPADFIYFHVGWINKKLDVDQFKTVRSCQDNGISCLGSLSDHFKLPTPEREMSLLLTE